MSSNNIQVIFDQFNIPSGPVLGLHLTCVTQSTERLPFRLDQFSGADHCTTVPGSESVVVPNLSIGLIGSDGVSCCNYNSAMDGFAMGRIAGDGVIERLLPPTRLVAESYSIRIMIWDQPFSTSLCPERTELACCRPPF